MFIVILAVQTVILGVGLFTLTRVITIGDRLNDFRVETTKALSDHMTGGHH